MDATLRRSPYVTNKGNASVLAPTLSLPNRYRSRGLQAGPGTAQIGLFGMVRQRAPRPWLPLPDRQQPADRARRGYNSVAIWGSLTRLCAGVGAGVQRGGGWVVTGIS
jgi:hypothetical protein